VTWYEAYAFCIWDGGFLPSEAEWEYAAAGGSEQLEYPWGATTPGAACPGTGCQYAIYNCDYPQGPGSCTHSGVQNFAPVGSTTLGAGLWGQFDMEGEVSEWNLDWYANYVDPCMDCAYLDATSNRVFRGGGFNYGGPYVTPPYRIFDEPTDHNYVSYGFRCARTP
jgi:formylglycine-generating enzyme required for sulfatase activity